MSGEASRPETARSPATSYPGWRVVLWTASAAMLCVPFIAMQFTSEVDWSLGDFLLFAGMLLALCAGIEAAMRIPAALRWRVTAICLLIVFFLTVWAELAVGIID